MTELHAKPIIDNKFWIVEQDGIKFATLRKNEDNKFVLSNKNGVHIFDNKKTIVEKFGKNFFVTGELKEKLSVENKEVYGFPSSTVPFNAIFDVKRKLPLYTKSEDSKSLYCAGYYVIKFEKGWVKSFCPKFITLQRYPFQGPFKSEIEMKQVLSNVSK